MKVSDKETASRTKRFEQVCREGGVKLTPQRMEVFRSVAETGDHPDAEMVYKRVRERMPTVSMDTVYRTLWLLRDLGLIIALGASRERARFDANLTRHHHFVCEHCGLTRDFYSDDFDEVKLPELLNGVGEVITMQVEARGICLGCAAKKHTEKRA